MSLIYTQPASRNNLYLGGKDDAKSLTKLQQRNVLRVLNVTPAKEAGITAGVPNYFEGKAGPGGYKIIYKRIPVYDASTSDMLTHADEIVNFISNGLHHGSVLVHCQRGVSRSATAVIMFLIRKGNMTYNQSLALCQRRRPVVDPIPAFRSQLMEYEKDCREWGYLTVVDEEDVKKKQVSNKTDASVCGDAETMSSPGEKRKVASDEVLDSDKRKKTKTVGPTSAPQNAASIGPTAKETAVGPSIGPSIGPSVGPSIGPSVKKLASIGPTMKPGLYGPSLPPSNEKSESQVSGNMNKQNK